MRSLSLRQEQLAHAYVEFDNATKAYVVVYGAGQMSPSALTSTASRAVRNPRLKPLVDRLRAEKLRAFTDSLRAETTSSMKGSSDA